MKKFNTCFFERYAMLTLERVLGARYSGLINVDRPDLQMPDKSLGIEVTRAMEENKASALSMLKEMAGINQDVIDTGCTYGFGLEDGLAVGSLEYEYWTLAQPLKRIVASKIEKVGSGFYGNFKDYGLFVFCKYDLSEEEVLMTASYARELQRHIDIKYSHLYLAQADKFYVCILDDRASEQMLGDNDGMTSIRTSKTIGEVVNFKESPLRKLKPMLVPKRIINDSEIDIYEFDINPILRREFFLGALRPEYPEKPQALILEKPQALIPEKSQVHIK